MGWFAGGAFGFPWALDAVGWVAGSAGPSIALGLDRGREYANRLGNSGAAYYRDWQRLNLYSPTVKGWGQAFHQAVGKVLSGGGRIHFELAGVRIKEALSGDPTIWVGRYTAWELQQIVANPAYRAATTFYLEGKALSAVELAKLGL
jgi:hypothetical protein